jgi:hypothetical protein
MSPKVNSAPVKSGKNSRALHITLAAQFIVIIALSAIIMFPWIAERDAGTDKESAALPPYSKEVGEIIKPLKYSYIPTILKSDFRIKVDFNRLSWRVYNIHNYDNRGNIELENGTSGICGDLAVYTYEKIKNIFSSDYRIEIVRVAQSGFFPLIDSTHYALKITEQSLFSGKTYVLDPSLNRYSTLDDFEDYIIFESTALTPLTRDCKTDEIIPVGTNLPILLKDKYILGISIEQLGGKFDPQNISLSLVMTKKYNYAGRFVYYIRNYKGKTEEYENPYLSQKMFSPAEFSTLKEKLRSIFRGITNP